MYGTNYNIVNISNINILNGLTKKVNLLFLWCQVKNAGHTLHHTHLLLE